MKVIIPGETYDRIKGLTRRDNEVSGFLLYRKLGLWEKGNGDARIASCYITKEGSPLSVLINNGRTAVLDKFLAKNTNYRAIDFHTHTEETIRTGGEYFRRKFSRRFMEEYNATEKRLGRSVILFSPDTSGELLYKSYPEEYEVVRFDWQDEDGRTWEEANRSIVSEIGLFRGGRGVPATPITEFYL